LDEESIFRGTDECFDFQILLQGFEEDLNVPTLPIDIGNSGSGEAEMIRQ
jgi:hypothetical protein